MKAQKVQAASPPPPSQKLIARYYSKNWNFSEPYAVRALHIAPIVLSRILLRRPPELKDYTRAMGRLSHVASYDSKATKA